MWIIHLYSNIYNGLRSLVDERSYIEMLNFHGEEEVTDIYAQEPVGGEEGDSEEASEWMGGSRKGINIMDNEDEVQKELNDEGTEIEEDTQPCAYIQQKENRCTQWSKWE